MCISEEEVTKVLMTWMEIYATTHFTMTCSPVGLISLMDRALCPVIAIVKVRYFRSSLDFFRFGFFNRLGCFFNCESHFHFQSYFCYSGKQNNFSNTPVLDPILSSFEASWLSSNSLQPKRPIPNFFRPPPLLSFAVIHVFFVTRSFPTNVKRR